MLAPHITIYTDSSTLGWCVTDENNPSGSRWKAEEINHINMLELKAIFIGVQTYCKAYSCKHVRVINAWQHNPTYVNNEGKIKSEFCNEIAKELWVFCTSQNMWCQLHISLEHKILRQTIFLEASMRLLSGNGALICFKKFQVCLETQQ